MPGTRAVAVLLVLGLPTVALGHAEWRPAQVPGGAAVPLVLFVPPEKPEVENVRIDLELLPGFRAPSCDEPPGWTCQTSSSAVSFTRRVPLSSESRFGVELVTPDEPGLRVFAVTQTYDDGTGVRWSGPPGDEFEGALLRVTGEGPPPRPGSPSPRRSPSSPSGPALEVSPRSPTPGASSGGAVPTTSPAPAAGTATATATATTGPVDAIAAPPVRPRTPGRFVLPGAADAGGRSLEERLVVLAAGGLLLAAFLGHAAAAARRDGRRGTGSRRAD